MTFFFAAGLSGCGDQESTPAGPADLSQWCDFERPREECTLNEAVILGKVSDVEPLCTTPCTRASLVVFEGEGTSALEGMRGFTEVGYLSVANDEGGREDLRGLETLEKIDLLDISGDNSLVSLEGLTNLRELGNQAQADEGEFVGLKIDSSDLQRLDGLDSLEIIQSLAINSAPISSLAPLQNVEIAESFDFSFTRLETIDSIVIRDPNFRSLRIANNDELTSLPALSGVDHVSGAVVVESNPNLSRCEIDPFVDGLETRPEERWIRISGNQPCEE